MSWSCALLPIAKRLGGQAAARHACVASCGSRSIASIDSSDNALKEPWGNPEADVEVDQLKQQQQPQRTERAAVHDGDLTLGASGFKDISIDVTGRPLRVTTTGFITEADARDMQRSTQDMNIDELAARVAGGEPAHLTDLHKAKDAGDPALYTDMSKAQAGEHDRRAGQPQGYTSAGGDTLNMGSDTVHMADEMHARPLEYEQDNTTGLPGTHKPKTPHETLTEKDIPAEQRKHTNPWWKGNSGA